MTDKQIIIDGNKFEKAENKPINQEAVNKFIEETDKFYIDGVDVSKCPHYIHKDGSCSSQDCECVKCVHNVCFYKSYKAKEQECEELKSTNKIYEQGIARLKDEKNNLKKENNSSKETIEGLLSIQYKLADSNLKLRQTLAEIKEIIEPMVKNGYFVINEIMGDFEKILQKINEVDNG